MTFAAPPRGVLALLFCADALLARATAAGRQQNRRVEVLFSDAQGRFMQR